MSSQNRWPLLALLIPLLTACASAPPPTPIRYEQPPGRVPTPELPPEQKQQAMILHLLDAGEQALAAGRFMYPLQDNAFDRFQAVLMLEPEHRQARSGLQAIMLHYLDAARAAGARNDFVRALNQVELASQIEPGNALVEELRTALQAQANDYRAQRQPLADQPGLRLDAAQLRRRDPVLSEQLVALAQAVRAAQEAILIVAGTDAEGRWIYQQMRDAVPGYLLRGDISIGSPPRVERLPAY